MGRGGFVSALCVDLIGPAAHHALKTPARRAEYSLSGGALASCLAEPVQMMQRTVLDSDSEDWRWVDVTESERSGAGVGGQSVAVRRKRYRESRNSRNRALISCHDG